MAISISGIPYGTQMTSRKSEYEATKQIVSDGAVDPAFVKQDDSFISNVTDDRVTAFLKDNTAPGPEWKAHELGGYDSANQSLFTEDDKVVLRSNTEEKGRTIRHLITAPYDAKTGAVNLEASSEGFNFAEPAGKSSVFTIPL